MATLAKERTLAIKSQGLVADGLDIQVSYLAPRAAPQRGPSSSPSGQVPLNDQGVRSVSKLALEQSLIQFVGLARIVWHCKIHVKHCISPSHAIGSHTPSSQQILQSMHGSVNDILCSYEAGAPSS